jgi:hypothetical protein
MDMNTIHHLPYRIRIWPALTLPPEISLSFGPRVFILFYHMQDRLKVLSSCPVSDERIRPFRDLLGP